MTNTDDFWKRIKHLIKIKAVTQQTALKACGISYNTFKGWVSKKYFPPLEAAYKLARYLGVSVDFLISGKGPDKAALINETSFIFWDRQAKLPLVQSKKIHLK